MTAPEPQPEMPPVAPPPVLPSAPGPQQTWGDAPRPVPEPEGPEKTP